VGISGRRLRWALGRSGGAGIESTPTPNERNEAMAEQDVDTIRGAYEAFGRGDVPASVGSSCPQGAAHLGS
jgi:hypothetical protein